MSERLGIIISGIRGRMGQALVEALEYHNNLELAGGLEHAEHGDLGQPIKGQGPKITFSLKQAAQYHQPACLIEFTSPEATLNHLEESVSLEMPMIIGTTGFTAKQLETIRKAAQKIPIVMAANFSIGVNLVIRAVEDLASRLPDSYDLEIIEAHHKHKKDAPSGTALKLAQALADGRGLDLEDCLCLHREGQIGARPKGQIGVQTLRGGDIVGDHKVLFAGPGERIEVTHQAHNRSHFANGALRAAAWLWLGKAGFRKPGLFDMFDVLSLRD